MARQKTRLQILQENLREVKQVVKQHKHNRGNLGCQYDYWKAEQIKIEKDIEDLREYMLGIRKAKMRKVTE